uniref:Nuclear receptor domain-containing protein n=1 Tax=Ascaris lumbricoides TaxID=6252 RepID=A0A0M3IJ37_ASCLU
MLSHGYLHCSICSTGRGIAPTASSCRGCYSRSLYDIRTCQLRKTIVKISGYPSLTLQNMEHDDEDEKHSLKSLIIADSESKDCRNEALKLTSLLRSNISDPALTW